MRGAALGLSACLVMAPAAAPAQGFGVNEHGACAMSRGGAAVAQPCDDGSAVVDNPAALVDRTGVTVGGGGTLIFGSGTFNSDHGVVTNLDSGVVIPPFGYLQYSINERLAIGAGISVPYGLTVKWPLGFEGRFVSYDSSLRAPYFQPTLAYAIGQNVSVGAGLTIVMASVEINRREDLARVPIPAAPGLTFGALVNSQTDFVNTTLSASRATGVGVNLGVRVKAHERVRVGVRYLSQVTLDFKARADFTPVSGPFAVTKQNPLGLPIGTPLDMAVAQVVSALPDQDVRTGVDLPAQFVTGVSVQIDPRVTIFGDYQWVDWSAFDTVTLDFSQPVPPDEEHPQNYRDTSAVRLGAEFRAGRARLSGGYVYNQAAAPDETVTPLLPEAKRHHLTTGFGWNAHTHWTLDIAYQFVASDDRRGRVVDPPPGELPTAALNSGVYRSRADLLGISLTYRR